MQHARWAALTLRVLQEASTRFDVLFTDASKHGQPFYHAEQGSAEWLAARRGRVTASDFGTVCGLSSHCTPQSAWQFATGRIGQAWSGNEHTRRGHELEPVAREWYSKLTGNEVETCGLFIHKAHDWLAASPDGLLGDYGILEIKCPAHRVHTSVPPMYMAQIQGQLEITGRDRCHFFSFLLDATAKQCALFEVQRSPAYWAWMLPKLQTFYVCVTADVEPSREELAMEDPRQAPPVEVQCLGTWS